jgi:hypothetical protein
MLYAIILVMIGGILVIRFGIVCIREKQMNEFEATDTWYNKAGEDNGECEAGLRNECDHIVGIDNSYYESILITKSDPVSQYNYIDKFNFCPDCGEKLKEG